jgi:CTP synthase (UTP-ammonia lyase)
MIRIALVGDYNPVHVSHRAIPEALRLAGAEGVWMHTDSIGNLAVFDGIWCVPASPYANTQAALDAIRFAREARLPFSGVVRRVPARGTGIRAQCSRMAPGGTCGERTILSS